MCGVIGIWANGQVFRDLYQGLLAIQHRGQDAAGIITYDGRFHTKKGNGLVRDIFKAAHAERLTGAIGIGHTRYPTIGGGRGEDAQPFQLNAPFGLIMAHNGNVVNYAALKKHLAERHHRLLNSDNDVESILNVFAVALEAQNPDSLTPEIVFRAVESVFRQVIGGYSVVAYIAGVSAPPEKRMGHAGAIIEGGEGDARSKVRRIAALNVPVASRPSEIPGLVRGVL